MWYKVESQRSYERPIQEEMLGQFFVELNDLSKYPNRRLKSIEDQHEGLPGKFEVFEGYFSMHDARTDVLASDRLGMRLFLFQKDETNELLTVDDLSNIFNLYRPRIEQEIVSKLDVNGKGYADCDELVTVCKRVINDEFLQQKLIWFIKSSL